MSSEPGPADVPRRRTWPDRLRALRGPVAAVAGAGAILSGLVGYWTTWRTVRQVAAPAAAAAPMPSALSIMVLPFKLLGADASQAYVADGLTSGITQDLGRIRDAFVLPATTAYAYRDKSLTLPALAQDAGVRFVLTGEVQQQGQSLRVRAQLSDGTSGRQLWSERFEGDLTNLFQLQDQITARIANSAERQMLVVAAAESQRRRSTPEAVDLALRARALGLRPVSLASSLELEEAARKWLAADPQSPVAVTQLGAVLSVRSINFRSELSEAQASALRLEAAALADRAMALDANDALALTLKARALRVTDPEAALRLLERAIDRDPKLRMAYNDLGLLLSFQDPASALQILQQGLALDPKNPGVFEVNIGTSLLFLGRWEEALAWGDRCAATNPQWAYCPELIAVASAMLGRSDRARAAAADVLRLSPGYRLTLEWASAQRAAPPVRERIESFIPALRALGLPD